MISKVAARQGCYLGQLRSSVLYLMQLVFGIGSPSTADSQEGTLWTFCTSNRIRTSSRCIYHHQMSRSQGSDRLLQLAPLPSRRRKLRNSKYFLRVSTKQFCRYQIQFTIVWTMLNVRCLNIQMIVESSKCNKRQRRTAPNITMSMGCRPKSRKSLLILYDAFGLFQPRNIDTR